MSKATKTAQAAQAFTASIMEVIDKVSKGDMDDEMTLADWNALGQFYRGEKTKMALTKDQRHMNELLGSFIGYDDHSLKGIIAGHFAGRIATINIDDVDVLPNLTKRRRIIEEGGGVEDQASSSSDSESEEEEEEEEKGEEEDFQVTAEEVVVE